MPLFLDDKQKLVESRNSRLTVIKENEFLNKSRSEFLENTNVQVDYEKCLYVGQREFATVRYDDKFIDLIGSDDATTCHIVLIVDQITNNCSLCHFDGTEVGEGVDSMIESLLNLRTGDLTEDNLKFDLYIVGGFVDDRGYSIRLSNELLDIFTIERPETFYLKLCCITQLNDIIKDNEHFPIIYGLGYNIKTKSAFMCNRFEYKGPEQAVRSARHFSSYGNLNIYDSVNCILQIGPFDYDVIRYAHLILQKDDQFILNHFSTSPKQEPTDFVSNFKRTLNIMMEHPEPLKTYFTDKKGKFFKKIAGQWEWSPIDN